MREPGAQNSIFLFKAMCDLLHVFQDVLAVEQAHQRFDVH